jgi:hypothetical protein
MIWILVIYFALSLSIHFVHSQFKVHRFAKRTLGGKNPTFSLPLRVFQTKESTSMTSLVRTKLTRTK